ncbi:MAG: hypothetical protein HY704_17620 [Gemmatimonadetes bacterium]|nr:hypothetical protein [Gemmatimonadota bacterium]
MTPGGWLVLGGVLDEEVEGLVAVTGTAGFRREDEVREEEWWSGLLVRG